MKLKFGFFVLLIALLVSCGEENYVPKPKAFLRLDYPETKYKKQEVLELPVAFEINHLVDGIKLKRIPSTTKSYGVNLEYTSLKATIFLTYKAIEGSENNLNAFLRDAQKLTLEHTKKADEIPVYPFENKERNVYGVLSEVKGNAASPAQFYVTDSVHHFLTGSLYFKTKPNYDSILPAANYIQKDMMRLMETLEWR